MTCKERNKMAETKKEGNYRYRLGKRTYAIRGRRIEGERKKERKDRVGGVSMLGRVGMVGL